MIIFRFLSYDRRIIIRDPYMLGIKENLVDIPYDIVTSVKLEKRLLSSTIRFKAPGLMSSTKLGMIDSLIDGEDDQGGIIEAIPKDKAQDPTGNNSLRNTNE
jgi:Bacterial PH domain